MWHLYIFDQIWTKASSKPVKLQREFSIWNQMKQDNMLSSFCKEGWGGWSWFSSNMYVCIMTLVAFVRKEILFFHASEVNVQGPWKIISSPRQAKLSAILTGFEKCVCVSVRACVHICALIAAMESPSSTFFSFYHPHISSTQIFQQSPANHSLPSFSCLYLRHTVTVRVRVLPWWSLMLPPHTMSPPVSGWGWIVVDDADRPRTSSLPLGIRPIFTGEHKVQCMFVEPHLLSADQDGCFSTTAYQRPTQAVAGSNNYALLYLLSCICGSLSLCKFHPGLIIFAPCRSEVLRLDDSNDHWSMLVAGLNDVLFAAGSSGWFALLPCWSITCGPVEHESQQPEPHKHTTTTVSCSMLDQKRTLSVTEKGP